MAQLRELQLELERQSLALERDQLDAQMRAEEPDSEDADTTVASRLARLSSELTQARRLLPDDHPEVRRIQNEIASIRSSGAGSIFQRYGALEVRMIAGMVALRPSSPNSLVPAMRAATPPTLAPTRA